eukprot:m.23878 g.23878  ORF g.23878 m.23878 type:complete len:355 (+) comp14386_c1_seq1:263-1327(+)
MSIMGYEFRIWHAQVIGFGLLAMLSNIVEKKAAMRGCQTVPLPGWIDRSLRIAFLGVLIGPVCVTLDLYTIGYPVLTSCLCIYMIPYSNLVEQRGGFSWLFMRDSIFVRPLISFIRGRIGLRLIKTVDLDPKQTYVVGIHPHSVLPIGAITAVVDESVQDSWKNLFPGVKLRILAATFVFYIPLYREMMLGAGVCDAARYSAKRILKLGYSIALVPGGATEALYSREDKDIVYITKRRGFVKLALEAGASLLPVYSFNECNVWSIAGLDSPMADRFKKKFQKIFGISLPLVTGVLKRTQVAVVVGSPIKCPQTDEPSPKMVEEYLIKYTQALESLYNDNRAKYNVMEKPPLSII